MTTSRHDFNAGLAAGPSGNGRDGAVRAMLACGRPTARRHVSLDGFNILRRLRQMPRRAASPSLLTRFAASATALLVTALVVFAASPTLHAWLHGHPTAPHPVKSAAHAGCTHSHEAPAPAEHSDEELCVVTQFAHGKADCGHPPVLALVATRRVTEILFTARPLAPRAPALFLPPGCGPPAV